MSELKEFDAIFEAALELLTPAHERLERLRQRIALLQREERHLTRTLAAREKAIEQARQALRAAAEEDERVLAETEAELQALEPASATVAVPDGRTIEPPITPEPALVGVEGWPMAILATSSKREEVAVSPRRGAATSASLEERLSPRQRELYGQLMERLVSGGPLELSAEEEELLACLPDEHRSGPGRPPAITRQVGRWIVALAKLPYSLGEICRTIGVSYSVYKRVRQDYPGFAAVLTYARTVRIARIAEARERAIQVAIATGDWRAAVQDHLDERRRLATEEREDPWADPAQIATLIAERLQEMVGGDGAAGPAGGLRSALGPEAEPAAAAADERAGDALYRP